MTINIDISTPTPQTYVFTLAGVQADKIGVVAAEVSQVDLDPLKLASSAELDLDPVMVALHTGAACLPSVAGVDAGHGQDNVGGLAIAVIARLDHDASTGERGKIENRSIFRENGRNVAKDTETSLPKTKKKQRVGHHHMLDLIDAWVLKDSEGDNSACRAYNATIGVHVQSDVSVDFVRGLETIVVVRVSVQRDLGQELLPLFFQYMM